MEFSQTQNFILQLLIEISSILSVIGSGSILLSTGLTGNFLGKNKFWNRIIFFMSFWDTCAAIDLILRRQTINNDDNCRIQGLTTHFFFLSSILWTAAFALTIFLIAVHNKKLNEVEKYEKYFHIVIWSVSVLLTVPLLMANMDGNTGSVTIGDTAIWCWNTQNYGKYRFFFFYIPVWAVFFFNIYFYFMSERSSFSFNDLLKCSFKKAKVKRSDLYLCVYFFTWIWGFINLVQNLVNKDRPIYVLYLLHAIFTPLQGFLNSIIYFWFSIIEHSDMNKPRKNKKNPNNLDRVTECGSPMSTYELLNEYEKPPKAFYNNSYEKIDTSEYGLGLSFLNDNDTTMTNDILNSMTRKNLAERHLSRGLPVSPTNKSYEYFNFVDGGGDNDVSSRLSLSIVNGTLNSLNRTMRGKRLYSPYPIDGGGDNDVSSRLSLSIVNGTLNSLSRTIRGKRPYTPSPSQGQ